MQPNRAILITATDSDRRGAEGAENGKTDLATEGMGRAHTLAEAKPQRSDPPSGAAARSRRSVRLNQGEHRTSNIEHRILNEERVRERVAVATTGEKNLRRWLSRRFSPGLPPPAIEQ